MAEAWIASFLAFFAGVIVGIYLGKRRWDKNIQEEDCEEPTEQGRVRTGAWSDTILVYTKTGTSFKHCAMLKEKAAPRRFTNRELAKWLSHGKGEWRYGDSDRVHTNICFGYECNKQHEIVDEKVKIRKWDDTEWHEPTVDYMGIEEKEEGTDV